MHHPMKVSDGQQITLRRDALGWKQPDLAAAVGVSLSTIVRVEGDDPKVSKAMRTAVLATLDKEERARGIGPNLSTPPRTTDPSQEGADVLAKLQRADVRLARIELVLAETLEDVRRARADLAATDASEQRKRG